MGRYHVSIKREASVVFKSMEVSNNAEPNTFKRTGWGMETNRGFRAKVARTILNAVMGHAGDGTFEHVSSES